MRHNPGGGCGCTGMLLVLIIPAALVVALLGRLALRLLGLNG
jgi:hypothetical protein